jgi:hypothetical protein
MEIALGQKSLIATATPVQLDPIEAGTLECLNNGMESVLGTHTVDGGHACWKVLALFWRMNPPSETGELGSGCAILYRLHRKHAFSNYFAVG